MRRKRHAPMPMERTMTEEHAQLLAAYDPDYYARCIRGKWVVWCDASDHAVEVDEVALPEDSSQG
jgi:hypothetical protein